MKLLSLFGFICLLVSAGCRVGPAYQPPVTPVPETWKNTYAVNCSATCIDYWWEVFDDPLLNDLEALAVQNNPTLYVALQHVFEARALAGAEAANLYPQLNLDPSYTSMGSLIKIQLPNTLPLNIGSIPPFRVHQMQYLLPLNLNYELDLWGKLHDQVDAAVFNADAQLMAYYSSMLTLTADLATTYFQLRGLDAQIDLLQATIKTRQKNYELTRNRFDKGLVTFLDVTQAETDLANAEASYAEAVRLRNLAENQIAVLVGQLPSLFCIEHRPLRDSPPVIAPGVPSTILLQRPDIAAAERTMASEHALVDAAYASFFPTFNLTGALGFLSPDFSHFLKWISRYWLIGVSSSQMVFDGGRDYYDLEAAWARFLEADGTYQQTVLTAFREVEDALNNIEQQNQQVQKLAQAVKSSRTATNISLNRYRGGVTIYLEVVENERIALQAEINWINQQSALYVSTVQLIKALGGSWEITPTML